jgi:hypothetical protein
MYNINLFIKIIKMNRQHDKIVTYINLAGQAYDNWLHQRHNVDFEIIEWIKSMLYELGITSIYDIRNIAIRDEENHEIYASMLECIMNPNHPYHEYANRIMRLQHMNRNKIEFINGISNLFIAQQEVDDMTEAESSENEELLAEED